MMKCGNDRDDHKTAYQRESDLSNAQVGNNDAQQEIDNLCTELTTALSAMVGNSSESHVEIAKVLSDAEHEVDDCKKAAESMLYISEAMKVEYLPAIRLSEKELTRLFAVLDAMEEVVIPALLEDLATIEGLVTHLEKRQAKKSGSVVTAFMSFLSSSTPSSFSNMGFGTSSSSGASQRGGTNPNNGGSLDASAGDLPCKLHDPKDMMAIIGCGGDGQQSSNTTTVPADVPLTGTGASSSPAAAVATAATTAVTSTATAVAVSTTSAADGGHAVITEDIPVS